MPQLFADTAKTSAVILHLNVWFTLVITNAEWITDNITLAQLVQVQPKSLIGSTKDAPVWLLK